MLKKQVKAAFKNPCKNSYQRGFQRAERDLFELKKGLESPFLIEIN
jgi:hypothetical protein